MKLQAGNHVATMTQFAQLYDSPCFTEEIHVEISLLVAEVAILFPV